MGRGRCIISGSPSRGQCHEDVEVVSSKGGACMGVASLQTSARFEVEHEVEDRSPNGLFDS